MNRKTPEKVWAAAATTAPTMKPPVESYQHQAAMATANLKDQIELLLWFLCSPLSREQSATGFRLLEVLLLQSYQGSSQSTHKAAETAPESTNLSRRAS